MFKLEGLTPLRPWVSYSSGLNFNGHDGAWPSSYISIQSVLRPAVALFRELWPADTVFHLTAFTYYRVSALSHFPRCLNDALGPYSQFIHYFVPRCAEPEPIDADDSTLEADVTVPQSGDTRFYCDAIEASGR